MTTFEIVPISIFVCCRKMTVSGSQRVIRVAEAMIMHKVSSTSAPPPSPPLTNMNPDHLFVENLSVV